MSGYYTVRQGDYLSKIARNHGFGDWRTIYDDPNNANFRTLRPDPNLIQPGDRLFIPTRGKKSSPCPKGSPKKFRVKGNSTTIHLVLHDARGQAVANAPYRLAVGGVEVKGTTDGSGVVRATVPASAEQATLTLADWTLPLLIGHLDPMPKAPNEGLSGVQGRLRNLGYEPGVIDGTLTDETRAAISAFEQDNSLPVTGQISQALKDKLRARYGC